MHDRLLRTGTRRRPGCCSTTGQGGGDDEDDDDEEEEEEEDNSGTLEHENGENVKFLIFKASQG